MNRFLFCFLNPVLILVAPGIDPSSGVSRSQSYREGGAPLGRDLPVALFTSSYNFLLLNLFFFFRALPQSTGITF